MREGREEDSVWKPHKWPLPGGELVLESMKGLVTEGQELGLRNACPLGLSRRYKSQVGRVSLCALGRR